MLPIGPVLSPSLVGIAWQWQQAYNLIVKLEDSDETGIEYVRVNTTEATASGDTSFHAVLPKNYNGNNDPLML